MVGLTAGVFKMEASAEALVLIATTSGKGFNLISRIVFQIIQTVWAEN